MSKIFRLYKEGTSTYEDWNNSPVFPYNSASRDTIEDPDGASARHEITSIPSPFARIDLIKTAFKEVCKPNKRTQKVELDGKTIFHKMVSDTLDVAEIFFNLDKYTGKVEVIKWDPSLMLAELEQSSIAGHRYLADALRKYMSSDSKTYNFDRLKNIYLLNYIEGPDELNIIGATSPATLFFSNANDLSYVNDIFFGEDRPFDSEYQPLYKRDFEFVKYLFALRKSIPNFAGLFPEVETYINNTYARVLIQHYSFSPGEVEHHYESPGLVAEDYRNLKEMVDDEIKPYTYIDTPTWHWIDIDGIKAIEGDYRRNGEDGPVKCKFYLLSNYNEMVKIIVTYREKDGDYWESDLNNIIRTFKWTSPR